MITREQAERIASEVTAPARREEWELAEFGAGWLIIEASKQDPSLRGGTTLVIELSGRVVEFPSYVPPARILNEYADVVADGHPRTGQAGRDRKATKG